LILLDFLEINFTSSSFYPGPKTLSLGAHTRSCTVRVHALSEQNTQQQQQQQVQEGLTAATEAARDAIDNATTAVSHAVDSVESELSAANGAPEAYTVIPSSEQQQDLSSPSSSGPLGSAQNFLRGNPVAYWSLVGMGAFLGVTFVIALGKTVLKGFSSQGKRTRTVNKNKMVVDEFSKYLPSNRAGLTGSVIGGIRFRTGFSPVELFRKYLWFLLRERKFDQEAVDDLITLKTALGLDDAQVAEALNERAKRVYDKYGNVMLDTTGMSAAGIERKATSRALFSKMQYLVENEALVGSPEEAANLQLRDIFGATEDDAARLRIVSLYEVDLDAAMGLPSSSPPEEQEQE
jgi:type II secretory pathway pseudopilin PulG